MTASFLKLPKMVPGERAGSFSGHEVLRRRDRKRVPRSADRVQHLHRLRAPEDGPRGKASRKRGQCLSFFGLVMAPRTGLERLSSKQRHLCRMPV